LRSVRNGEIYHAIHRLTPRTNSEVPAAEAGGAAVEKGGGAQIG
jgi:hypothetical protein